MISNRTLRAGLAEAFGGVGLVAVLAAGVLAGNIGSEPGPHMSSGGTPFPSVVHQGGRIGYLAEIEPPGKGIVAGIEQEPGRGP